LFYKYYPPKDYVIDSLEKAFLYFSFSDKLNDPFDTYLSFELFGNKNEWINFLKTELHYSHNDAEEYFVNNNIIENEPYSIPLFEDNYRMAYVISSFTTKPDNSLMWSHYSNSHKGICIGYKTVKPSNFNLIQIDDKREINSVDYNGIKYLPLRKVDYLHEKPKPFNPLQDDQEQMINNVIQKSDIWKYEDEYRLAMKSYDPRKNIVYYNKLILSDIYIGINTDLTLIKEIIKIAKFVYNSDIKIHYPLVNYKDYRVKFD